MMLPRLLWRLISAVAAPGIVAIVLPSEGFAYEFCDAYAMFD
jgi:hypothetical protein